MKTVNAGSPAGPPLVALSPPHPGWKVNPAYFATYPEESLKLEKEMRRRYYDFQGRTSEATAPSAYYLGAKETFDFDQIAMTAGFVYRQIAYKERREFMGVPIYRVDADTHLAVA